VEERLQHALIKGIGDYLETDIQEALRVYPRVVDIIEQPLMEGMNKVGVLFGEGKMFLPQVVKTARTMKKAVAILQPYLEAGRDAEVKKAGKVLLATVKGDVHDIGKNIVSVVMACNNYDIIDMGVMVPAEEIVKKALEEKVDLIGLSGLITPSLDEMVHVAMELHRVGLQIPIMIGGATTSALHTALKIAPVYDGPVVHLKDASQNVLVAARLMNPEQKEAYVEALKQEQAELRERNASKQARLVSMEEALKNKLKLFD
jgi:5-methyltetrahydrofolate--homocysteine methyltransferase